MARENKIAPRIGFAFMPMVDERTIIRGGIGLFYDDIDMNVSTFSQLQQRVLTSFGLDGQEIVGVPQRQRFVHTEPEFRTARSVNWNIQVDREWIRNLFVRVGYQQRQARRGLCWIRSKRKTRRVFLA